MEHTEHGFIRREFEKYKMATTAIHQLGDISSEEEDLCFVYAEDEDNWYGQWVTGLGFFDVRFPKSTTRDLTEQEVEKYSKLSLYVNGKYVEKTLQENLSEGTTYEY